MPNLDLMEKFEKLEQKYLTTLKTDIQLRKVISGLQ